MKNAVVALALAYLDLVDKKRMRTERTSVGRQEREDKVGLVLIVISPRLLVSGDTARLRVFPDGKKE